MYAPARLLQGLQKYLAGKPKVMKMFLKWIIKLWEIDLKKLSQKDNQFEILSEKRQCAASPCTRPCTLQSLSANISKMMQDLFSIFFPENYLISATS